MNSTAAVLWAAQQHSLLVVKKGIGMTSIMRSWSVKYGWNWVGGGGGGLEDWFVG